MFWIYEICFLNPYAKFKIDRTIIICQDQLNKLSVKDGLTLNVEKHHRRSANYSLKSFKIQTPPIPNIFNFTSHHHKWLPYQILGGKTLKNVQIDQKNGDMVGKAK